MKWRFKKQWGMRTWYMLGSNYRFIIEEDSWEVHTEIWRRCPHCRDPPVMQVCKKNQNFNNAREAFEFASQAFLW